jgi:hypothetical protein
MHLWYAGGKTKIYNHALKDKIFAIHIYDSIIVMEKRIVEAPKDIKAGNYTVGYLDDEKPGLWQRISYFIFKVKNRVRSSRY